MRSVAEIRQSYRAGREALRARFPNPRRSSPVLHELTALSDTLLAELWHNHAFPADFLLIAVGGYGRREQYPFSDTDLLILLPEHVEPGQLEAVSAFVG